MANKHIVESLVEANKKIVELSNKIENEAALDANRQTYIDGINTVIRNLDHIVESLEERE